ncbi:hypothetical protein WJX73_003793 [Symbiochloris irregularis]|uniref:Uncharacterized protein n=1 Tax=Symbiochloris irregularis TaxID=706552 RepID=A0AAW1NQM8_9CHLO
MHARQGLIKFLRWPSGLAPSAGYASSVDISCQLKVPTTLAAPAITAGSDQRFASFNASFRSGAIIGLVKALPWAAFFCGQGACRQAGGRMAEREALHHIYRCPAQQPGSRSRSLYKQGWA